MGLGKTDKGRRVLAERSAGLSPRERQALVLCDGRRRPEELHDLLGAEGPALLRRLLDDGFIVRGQGASRTSLAGAKMYLIDMLQLLRDADASAHAVALHMAQDEAALVSAMAQAMGFVRQASPASYAARVHERLAALLPEPHRAALGPAPTPGTGA